MLVQQSIIISKFSIHILIPNLQKKTQNLSKREKLYENVKILLGLYSLVKFSIAKIYRADLQIPFDHVIYYDNNQF